MDGIDLGVHRGECFGFLGPNGAGKTTTMRMLSCLSARDAGDLEVLGMDPDVQPRDLKARLGVVPQEVNLDLELTVLENMLVYGRYFGMARDQARERALDLLRFVDLHERADDTVVRLSGGMQRRLQIARALINDPEMILLDEPTTGLDPQARHVLWDRLYRLKQQGVTLVLTTHYMDEAEQLCDRLVVMDKGRIVAEGSPRSLIEQHATREVLELRFAAGTNDERMHDVAGLGSRQEVLPDRILVIAGQNIVELLEQRGVCIGNDKGIAGPQQHGFIVRHIADSSNFFGCISEFRRHEGESVRNQIVPPISGAHRNQVILVTQSLYVLRKDDFHCLSG